MKLGEALFYEQPTKYIVESEFYNSNYKTPVLTAGKSFILGYTNESNGIYKNLPCIIFDDFTTDIKYVDFPFKVKSSAMKILTTNNENDLRYLYYFLSTIKLDTELHKRYWISKYAELNVKLPLFSEQKQIAGELDVVCGAMEKQKKQLELCDTLIKSKFNEMFGDVKSNNKNYESVALKNIFDEITSSKRIFANEYIDKGIPFYRSKEIVEKEKKLPVTLELFISKNKYEELKSKFGIPKINDILITAVGTIGSMWIVDNDDPFYFKDGNIIWLKSNDRNSVEYLKFCIKIKVEQFKNKMSIGSAYSALTIVTLKELKIPLPPLPLQQKFADFVNEVEQNKAKIKQSLSETETLYKALMQKYFDRGEVQ